MPKLKCQKDFAMSDGTLLAFRAGRDYEWRWATQEEETELGMGTAYVFVSELGEHFMGYGDVERAFA